MYKRQLKIDINAVKNKCESNFNKLERNIEGMGEWRTDIGKCKINENNGDISVLLLYYNCNIVVYSVTVHITLHPPTYQKLI